MLQTKPVAGTEGVLSFLKKLNPDLAEVTLKMQHTNVSKGGGALVRQSILCTVLRGTD